MRAHARDGVDTTTPPPRVFVVDGCDDVYLLFIGVATCIFLDTITTINAISNFFFWYS